MKRMIIWIYLTCKRYLKRPSFCILLLLFPLGAFAVGQGTQDDTGEIRVAVALEQMQSGDLGERLIQTLLDGEAGKEELFRFYLCDTEEQVMEEVASRRAECGYVIPGNLGERLNRDDYKRSILVYSAPSTVTSALSTEVVFSKLTELHNRDLLKEYVTENDSTFASLWQSGHVTQEQLAEEAGPLYDKWLTNDSTFRFEYETVEGGTVETKSPLPIRGLAAVYVFVTGLFAAMTMLTDVQRGLFLPLSYAHRGRCQVASLAAPVILAALSGMVALAAGGVLQVWWRELFAMTVYATAVVLFSYALSRIIKSPAVLGCTIPVLAVSSLIFCPVFLDIGRLIDGVDILGKWLLPYYYIRFFP